MAYNPLRLRLHADGVMRDKYGRVFEFDPERFDRAVKTHAWPAYQAHTVSQSQDEHPLNPTTERKRADVYNRDS